MKKIVYSMIFATVVAIGFTACNNTQPAETQVEQGLTGAFNADVTNSVVNWKGQMVGLYFHTGTLSVSEGSLSLENGSITGGKFTIDLKTMTTTDNNYDSAEGRVPSKLVGHLSSPDFFAVDTFPTATFVITSSDSTGVMGDLTVRGVTNSEKIQNVVVTENENGITVTGTLVFDRTKYGVVFQMAAQDMIVSNDVELSIELTAKP